MQTSRETGATLADSSQALTAVEPDVRTQRIRRQVTIGIALLAVFLLGLRFDVRYTISLGYIIGLVLMPLWVGVLRRYSMAVLFTAVSIFALISGFWLASVTSGTHNVTEQYVTSDAALVAGVIITVGVVLWAREYVPDWVVGAVFGAGMICQIPLGSDGDITNAWKQIYSLPIAVLLLALAGGTKRRLVSIFVLLGLAAFSAANDSRSMAAELGVATLLLVWQYIPRGRSLKFAAIRTVLSFGIIALIVYDVILSLLVDGFLGTNSQDRTIAQIDTSGSVILGGRPELAATIALMHNQPWGYGLGVQPTLGDIQVAKTGMAAINYLPNNGYVENYMFGQTFEMHSMFGDLWARLGIPGLLLVVLIGVITLRWIAVAVARREAIALTLFLAVLNMWNLLFSPFYTSSIVLGLTIGLMLLRTRPISTTLSLEPRSGGDPGPVAP